MRLLLQSNCNLSPGGGPTDSNGINLRGWNVPEPSATGSYRRVPSSLAVCLVGVYRKRNDGGEGENAMMMLFSDMRGQAVYQGR